MIEKCDFNTIFEFIYDVVENNKHNIYTSICYDDDKFRIIIRKDLDCIINEIVNKYNKYLNKYSNLDGDGDVVSCVLETIKIFLSSFGDYVIFYIRFDISDEDFFWTEYQLYKRKRNIEKL